MINMDYMLEDNMLTASDLLRLRESAGWGSPAVQQIEAGIKNSLFTVVAKYNDDVIGMGWLVGDGFTICYIQDVIVLPEFQGKGIGKAIVERLLKFIKDNGMSDTHISVGLFSAKGKEGFYQKFGFVTI